MVNNFKVKYNPEAKHKRKGKDKAEELKKDLPPWAQKVVAYYKKYQTLVWVAMVGFLVAGIYFHSVILVGFLAIPVFLFNIWYVIEYVILAKNKRNQRNRIIALAGGVVFIAVVAVSFKAWFLPTEAGQTLQRWIYGSNDRVIDAPGSLDSIDIPLNSDILH